MREESSARVIAYVLVGIIGACFVLAIYGFASTAKHCSDRGGSYVRTATGYSCIGDDKSPTTRR